MWRYDLADISHHNYDAGPFDWDIYTDVSPGSGAVAKLTQRHNYVDPTGLLSRFEMERKGLRRRGLYHWQSPVSEASVKDQFEHIKRTYGQFELGEFFMLDAEQFGIIEPESADLLERVEGEITGRPSAHYGGISTAGGVSWRSDRIRQSAFGPRTMWLAAYMTQEKLAARLKALHIDHLETHVNQWSSNGVMPDGSHVPFSVARTDMNQVNDFTVLDLACGYTSTPQPGDLDMPTVITNLAPRVFEGVTYQPGAIKWALMDDGTKRHMGIDHKLFGSPAGTAASNADLDACPDYVPPVTVIPPVVIPPITVPPLTGHIAADLGAGGHITGSIG